MEEKVRKCQQDDALEGPLVTYLVLIVEELGELWDGSGCQLCVVLVVDQVDHSVLEHLRGLRQPLHVGGICCVILGGRDLNSLLEGLWEHGSAYPLRTCHGVLTIDVYQEQHLPLVGFQTGANVR